MSSEYPDIDSLPCKSDIGPGFVAPTLLLPRRSGHRKFYGQTWVSSLHLFHVVINKIRCIVSKSRSFYLCAIRGFRGNTEGSRLHANSFFTVIIVTQGGMYAAKLFWGIRPLTRQCHVHVAVLHYQGAEQPSFQSKHLRGRRRGWKLQSSLSNCR
jgi:hypothetical protein